MSFLPAGWKRETLSSLCVINPKKSEVKEIPDDTEVSFVPMDAVDAEKGEIRDKHVRRLKDVRKGYTYFRDGDILFAKITPCMENGKAAIAQNLKNGIGFGSTEFHILRPREGILKEYLFHYVRQPAFREEAGRKMTGTAGQLRVPTIFIETYELPVPPIPVQKLIIAEVEKQLTRLQEGTKSLKALKEKLEVYRKSFLKKAFSGVGKRVKISDIAEVVRGASPRPKGDPRYFGGNIPWIKISDVSNLKGKEIYQTKEGVTEEGAKKSRCLDKGTLILSNSGTVCVPKILGVRGCIHDGFVAFLNLSNNLNKLFLYHYFDHIRPRIINENRQGITQVNLNTTIVKSIELPLPDLSTQEKIVREIESQLSVVDKIEEVVDKNLINSEKLKKSILKSAFEGKLAEGDD